MNKRVSNITKATYNEREKASRECIEIEDDETEENENKDRNVSKNRKAIKQNSLITQTTARKEAKTSLKTPQGRHN